VSSHLHQRVNRSALGEGCNASYSGFECNVCNVQGVKDTLSREVTGTDDCIRAFLWPLALPRPKISQKAIVMKDTFDSSAAGSSPIIRYLGLICTY